MIIRSQLTPVHYTYTYTINTVINTTTLSISLLHLVKIHNKIRIKFFLKKFGKISKICKLLSNLFPYVEHQMNECVERPECEEGSLARHLLPSYGPAHGQQQQQ